MKSRKEILLEPGRVYRTRDFNVWNKNAPRLAKAMVNEGKLKALAHGLFVHPKVGKFGPVPPTDQELMRAFLGDGSFVFTGPELWNTLGLGTTAVNAVTLVYNTKRSGEFEFAGRRFRLRRNAFPPNPSPEWFAIDLFEHAEEAGADRSSLMEALHGSVRQGNLSATRLSEMAELYATKVTQRFLAPVWAAVPE